VSIRGESGSGKTTLLNLLAGLDASEGGDVAWAGASITGLSNNALAGTAGAVPREWCSRPII
jgi:ABC-type lipoprotein export system ATPase subunit